MIIMNYMKISGLFGFILYGGLYIVMFAIVSYVFSMNNYEKNLINSLLVKFHIKKVNYGKNSCT